MFKKLRQKIEEGGEGGLENVSFSPSKLPGSIVRATSLSDEERSHSPLLDIPLESQPPISAEVSKWDQQKGELPTHLSSKSHVDYQQKLEFRVNELEQACSSLNQQLQEETNKHVCQQSVWETKVQELDKKATELKMRIVELELEVASKRQECEDNARDYHASLQKQKEITEEQNTVWMKQVNQLTAEIEEKERCIISEENKYDVLEKKAQHFESQLKAYESASENEVVNRLHYEVADVEQRVKSRNLEIQILERRLASQAKENEEQTEKLINRQEELETLSRELTLQLKDKNSANKALLKELEVARQRNIEIELQRQDFHLQLTSKSQAEQRLAVEYKQLQRRHEEKIQEWEHLLEDKEKYIKDLLHQLKLLRGNTLVQALPHPPGVARRTMSIACQTDDVKSREEVAILPTSHQEHSVHDTTAASMTSAGSAAMTSLSPDEAMLVLREQQLRLEEELSEKLKIIKVQQQKIMDIKKELRLQKTTADMSGVSNRSRRSPSPPVPTTTLRVAIASDVNFKYLKHVVIKFMCSREDEALQLIRAVSTLLEFTQQEEEHVKRYLNYKMSWFGAIPPPLFAPMQAIK